MAQSYNNEKIKLLRRSLSFIPATWTQKLRFGNDLTYNFIKIGGCKPCRFVNLIKGTFY